MLKDVDFFRVVMVGVDGSRRRVLIGFADNGTVWLEAQAIGIGPKDGKRLVGDVKDVVLMDHERQLVFVNAVALVGLMDDPQWREEWLRHVEELIERYRRSRALYGSPGNN